MSPDKDRYHNLREKLGIDQLDEQSRKQMLEKLRKAGGKVDFSIFDKENETGYKIFQRKDSSTFQSDIIIDGIKKRTSSKNQNIYKKDRAAIKNYKIIDKRLEAEKAILKKVDKISKNDKIPDKSIASKEKNNDTSIKNVKSIKDEDESKNKSKRNLSFSLTDRILFAINGYIFKVLTFKISRLHQDFLIDFFPHYASTISKLGYFIKGCINSAPIKKKLRETLGKLSPLHYDIIHQFLNLADEDYLSIFYEKSFEKFSSIIDDDQFEKFSFYFKKLLFIREHSGVFEISMLTTRNIYMQFYRLNVSEQELLNDINFIITSSYEKFHILFCINIGKYLAFNSQAIKDYLKSDETDNIGYYYKKEKEEEEASLKSLKDNLIDKKKIIEEDIEKKEIAKIPDDVKKGFEFMDDIQKTFENHLEEFMQSDRILQRINSDDKIALTYIFYKELNEQYTIFMTSKDIGYKIKFEEHKKVDIKTDLNNVLNSLNLLYQDFELYAENSLKLKIKSEQTFYDETLNQDKENMLKLSVSIRNKLIEILQNFLVITMKIIKDYTDKNFFLIDNPEEKLYLDERLHGIKKFNGKPIIYIYTRAYYFIKAFIYRLEKTDLSGLKLEIEE
ncbi:MAG: hypothetical protein ACK4YF_03540 [Exilispira sp.]